MASKRKQKKAIRGNRDAKKQVRRHRKIVKKQKKEARTKGVVVVK